MALSRFSYDTALLNNNNRVMRDMVDQTGIAEHILRGLLYTLALYPVMNEIPFTLPVNGNLTQHI